MKLSILVKSIVIGTCAFHISACTDDDPFNYDYEYKAPQIKPLDIPDFKIDLNTPEWNELFAGLHRSSELTALGVDHPILKEIENNSLDKLDAQQFPILSQIPGEHFAKDRIYEVAYKFAGRERGMTKESDRNLFANEMSQKEDYTFVTYADTYYFIRENSVSDQESSTLEDVAIDQHADKMANESAAKVKAKEDRAIHKVALRIADEVAFMDMKNSTDFAKMVLEVERNKDIYLAVYNDASYFAHDSREIEDENARDEFAQLMAKAGASIFRAYESAYLFAAEARGMTRDEDLHKFASELSVHGLKTVESYQTSYNFAKNVRNLSDEESDQFAREQSFESQDKPKS